LGRRGPHSRKNGDIIHPPINPEAEIHLFGQEVNPDIMRMLAEVTGAATS
jgi:hypothetical protein